MSLKTTLKTATLAVAVFVCASGLAHADERLVSSDAEIAALLGGATARNALSRQVFAALPDGPGSHAATTYSSGSAPSEGLWTARGGQYCSLWGDLSRAGDQAAWDCYDVLVEELSDRIKVVWRRNGARDEAFITKP